MLAALVQPLSANDIVAIGAMIFGGTVLIIRAMKDKPTAADAKVEVLSNQLNGVVDQVNGMGRTLENVALHTQPPVTTTTTSQSPGSPSLSITTKPANPAMDDTVAGMTLPLDGQPLPKKP